MFTPLPHPSTLRTCVLLLLAITPCKATRDTLSKALDAIQNQTLQQASSHIDQALAQDQNGNNASELLHCAIEHNNLAIVNLLIQKKNQRQHTILLGQPPILLPRSTRQEQPRHKRHHRPRPHQRWL